MLIKNGTSSNGFTAKGGTFSSPINLWSRPGSSIVGPDYCAWAGSFGSLLLEGRVRLPGGGSLSCSGAVLCRQGFKRQHWQPCAESNVVRAAQKQGLPKGSYTVLHLDLASLESVRQFVDAFHATGRRLDALVCNAAVYLPTAKVGAAMTL